MLLPVLFAAAVHGSAPCIPGTEIQYFDAGTDGSTFGEEYVAYDPAADHVTLAQPANAEQQMYLYAGGMWIFGEDWCFDAGANTVRFLRSPLRIYAPGGVAGEEIGPGTIVWLGYNPASGS